MKFNLDTVKAFAITGVSALAFIWLIRRTEMGKKVTAAALAG